MVIKLQPENAPAHANIGATLLQLGEIERSRASLEHALRIEPDNIDARLNLGNVFTALGQTNESVRCSARSGTEAESSGCPNQRAVCLNYCDSLRPADVAQECLGGSARSMERRFHDGHPQHSNQADPGRRLRIGYVSPDFRRHAVALFLEPLFRHDRSVVEIFCYAEVIANPDQYHRIDFRSVRRSLALDPWRQDDDLAARIQEDGIDILVDLAGHTDNNRLPVFARRPAPVQMTWLGYPNYDGPQEHRLSVGRFDHRSARRGRSTCQ